MSTFRLFLFRELKLLFGNQEALIQPIFFFLITVSLFPFSIGSNELLLTTIMPSIVWVAIVLATMMSLNQLFRLDYDDGSLEQWLLGNRSLVLIVLAKSAAHWLCNGLFLSLLACLVCYASNIPWPQIEILFDRRYRFTFIYTCTYFWCWCSHSKFSWRSGYWGAIHIGCVNLSGNNLYSIWYEFCFKKHRRLNNRLNT